MTFAAFVLGFILGGTINGGFLLLLFGLASTREAEDQHRTLTERERAKVYRTFGFETGDVSDPSNTRRSIRL
jgi:hypothetical protein